MDTGTKGTIAHALAIGKLTLLGYNVSVPVGSLRYDLIAEKDGKSLRCQVKYVTAYRGRLPVKCYSSPRSGSRRKVYTSADIDVILVYWAKEARWYWLDFHQLTNGTPRFTIDLRIVPVRGSGGASVRWAREFEV